MELYGNEKYTDEELEKALIEAGGHHQSSGIVGGFVCFGVWSYS